MAENVHMYHEEKIDENINIKQEAKSIIPRVILKWPNLKIIDEVKDKEADVNLRKGSNPLPI